MSDLHPKLEKIEKERIHILFKSCVYVDNRLYGFIGFDDAEMRQRSELFFYDGRYVTKCVEQGDMRFVTRFNPAVMGWHTIERLVSHEGNFNAGFSHVHWASPSFAACGLYDIDDIKFNDKLFYMENITLDKCYLHDISNSYFLYFLTGLVYKMYMFMFTHMHHHAPAIFDYRLPILTGALKTREEKYHAIKPFFNSSTFSHLPFSFPIKNRKGVEDVKDDVFPELSEKIPLTRNLHPDYINILNYIDMIEDKHIHALIDYMMRRYSDD